MRMQCCKVEILKISENIKGFVKDISKLEQSIFFNIFLTFFGFYSIQVSELFKISSMTDYF